MSVFAHSVRAFVLGDWHEQGCKTANAAIRLFDRLRALDPGLNVQRLHNGRAVEIAGRTTVRSLTEQQRADQDLLYYGVSVMQDGRRIDPLRRALPLPVDPVPG